MNRLFLMGLNKYGKGDWRSISRYYVVTKTPTQVASHAQKYFRRQSSSTPMDRRRPSIHDIQTVSSIPTPATQRNESYNNVIPNIVEQSQSIHFSPDCSLMIPRLNHNFVNGDLNPMFLPMNSTSFQPSANPVMNQGSAAYPSSYQPLSSLKNQQWG
ncbi:hypothetical protein RD792_013072 [Penstemon davidsonii]|uniref:HTH myb-type domain-containing protein n=1 Tax=Penstemon davidsonii TaxID=160366 RepID=A0ABR0CSF1_9LAMI|nr:hypothetical protein RD792_013072 [Penstemon davidsonii]